MRRSFIKISVPVVLATAVFVAGSATAVVAPAYGRLTFVDDGIRIDCTDGSCPVPIVVPWTVEFPDMGPYDAVITAAVSYRTSSTARAALGARLSEEGEATSLPLSSGPRRLPPSTKWNAVTVSWLAEDLAGATTYDLSVGLSPVPPAQGPSFVESKDVLITVEAAPV